MDIRCTNCGEPWDAAYLREDVIWEAVDIGGLPEEVAKNWNGTLTDEIRGALSDWVFGSSIYVIEKCPSCPKVSEPKKDPLKDMLADILGDDEDGLLAELEDLELWNE